MRGCIARSIWRDWCSTDTAESFVQLAPSLSTFHRLSNQEMGGCERQPVPLPRQNQGCRGPRRQVGLRRDPPARRRCTPSQAPRRMLADLLLLIRIGLSWPTGKPQFPSGRRHAQRQIRIPGIAGWKRCSRQQSFGSFRVRVSRSMSG